MSTPEPPASRPRLWRIALIAAAVAVLASLAITALLVNIFERKQEARQPFAQVVELNEQIDDPAVWGKNFPLQYDDYKRTVDMVRTRYGGSEAVPHGPTKADPRTVVAQSRIEEDPRLKEMWNGYAFAVDFREERGHAYMLEDQTFTERQNVTKQPGTCINCHASTVTAYAKLGGGDPHKGFDVLNKMPYAEARKEVQHPVACIDCHDPKTMALRVTRPAFMEGIKKAKAAEGVADFQVNRDATRQEMRTYVCGQCHVEYYFAGPEKKLTYPWDKGLKGDQILAYYQENGHKDWTHKDSGAPALKAQHPEFELYNQGVHARSGVACADCHMPYKREGAMKISDHHVRSPMLNVAGACQTCHRLPEAELRQRVEGIQSRHMEMRNRAMDALLDLIRGLKQAKDAGATDEQLAKSRDLQRQAQFLLDFAEAENSTGFHAPQEAARLMTTSIDYSRQGSLWLAKTLQIVPDDMGTNKAPAIPAAPGAPPSMDLQVSPPH